MLNVVIRGKSIGITCSFKAQARRERELMENFLIWENQPRKLKNSESNKNLEVKKNINIYIPWQTILPKRRCL